METAKSSRSTEGVAGAALEEAVSTIGRREARIGGFGGGSYTYPSPVRIARPGDEARKTDMTVSGFDWIGRPFKSPIYYGARIQHVPAAAGLGVMVELIHAKAIADPTSNARLTGVRDGRPVPPNARMDQYFRHLEFSHGHNILTGSVLYRWPAISVIRPYAGLGTGVSLPHTEIGFKDENARTYEYQFAGLAGQVFAGLEIPVGPLSVFIEWKFTHAPYSVPLSHEPYGWLLVTDVWRQFRSWMARETPPGGVLTTTLNTHHGAAGVMVRVGPSAAAR
jgi:hypothetical protein